MTKQEQLVALRAKLNTWEEKSRAARKRIAELQLEIDREKFNCECVRLNKDIDIEDMGELYAAGRQNVLDSAGLVGNCLSVLVDCRVCHGTGRGTR